VSADETSAGPGPIRAELTGVPETLLWTLYYRAQEAARPDAVLSDPLAIDLVARIDYPFAERLGRGVRRAQWQGLRARTFDDRVRQFLARHPGGTVVALGEGLETQFWRVDDGAVRWVGVDLPAAGELRRQVLPSHPRRVPVEASVLDDSWQASVEQVAGGGPVMLTAQGLLMYLRRDQVLDLLTRCGRSFPGAELVFDGVPRWSSWVTTASAAAQARAIQSGREPASAMVAPSMPWPMNDREAAVLRRLPTVAEVRRLHPPRGRGVAHSVLLPLVDRMPVLRSQVLSIWSATFAR